MFTGEQAALFEDDDLDSILQTLPLVSIPLLF